MRTRVLLASLLAFLVACSDAGTPDPPVQARSTTPTPEQSEALTPTPTVAAVPTEPAAVTRVIDGDTVEVRMSTGSVERVRLIGIDSPESTTTVEPFGKKASAYAKKLLPVGKPVFLELDVDHRDRYGRLLAYVWLAEPSSDSDEDLIRGRMVNAVMMLRGWAQLLTIVPNVKYVDYFTMFQTEARIGELGLWAPPEEPPDTGGGNCDPSYPDVCIPPPPPDLDCGDVPYKNIRVVGDDPHNFDGNDNDGIGCES